MISFEVTILGNNSALPAHGRHPSSQYITVGTDCFLIDCGEGTQLQIARSEKKAFSISHIFISHLHGDHFYGLVALLSSLSLYRRQSPLHIYAPIGLQYLLDSYKKHSGLLLNYVIYFHVIPEGASGFLCETKHATVHCFPLEHRIACSGFKITEKITKRKINIEAVQALQIPKIHWNNIQLGEDYALDSGEVIANENLTYKPREARSYCYCSDTRYNQSIHKAIMGATTAYIESTYTQQEKELATERYHCTAKDAAKIAREAGIKELLLGHFSSRYKSLSVFEDEARELFLNTHVSIEGKTYEIGHI